MIELYMRKKLFRIYQRNKKKVSLKVCIEAL